MKMPLGDAFSWYCVAAKWNCEAKLADFYSPQFSAVPTKQFFSCCEYMQTPVRN